MKYISVVLMLVASLFLGCGGSTDIDVKSSNISATTADGTAYVFSGNIVAQWRSYGATLTRNDKIEVYNVRVYTDGKEYTTPWSWSKKIKDLKNSDIYDQETDIPISFTIELPSSTTERSCEVRYTLSLDGDDTGESIHCTLPIK